MIKDMNIGSPYKLLIIFALPVALGSLFQQLYSLIDAVIVGQYVGLNALAALGSVGSLFYLVIGFTVGLGAGFSVILSQEFGAKNYKNIKTAYAMSIILTAIISLLLSLLFCLTSKDLLLLLRTPENILDMANEYIFVIYAGLIAFTFFNFFSAVLRSFGDSRTPLIFLIVASGLNILLDLVFVLIFPLGCLGVAIATILAQSLAALLTLIYIRKKLTFLNLEKSDWKINLSMIKRLLAIGLPAAFQYSVCAIGMLVLQVAVNSFGSDIIAAYSISTKLEYLYSLPIPAIGAAISTYAAQNFGAGNHDRINKGFKAAVVLIIIWSLIAMLINYAFSPLLATAFLPDTQNTSNVLSNALTCINLELFFFIALGLIFVYRTGDQGLGAGSAPMISSIIELVVRSLGAIILPLYLGVFGLYLASPLSWLSAAIFLPLYHIRVKKRLNIK